MEKLRELEKLRDLKNLIGNPLQVMGAVETDIWQENGENILVTYEYNYLDFIDYIEHETGIELTSEKMDLVLEMKGCELLVDLEDDEDFIEFIVDRKYEPSDRRLYNE